MLLSFSFQIPLVHNWYIDAVVHSLSCVRLFATPSTTARQASLSFTISWSLLKLMSIESVMPSNHLILSVAPYLSCRQSFPSIRVFSTSQLFTSGGQSVETSASVLPMTIQSWFSSGLTGGWKCFPSVH